MDGVEALCKAYTSSAAFTTGTQPTLAEVEQWLTEGYRLINVILAEYGYAPDQTDVDVKGALQPYNVWYAASQVEYSQASAGFSEGSSGRGDLFSEMFWGSRNGFPHPGIKALIKSDGFAALGATVTTAITALLSAGGISRADKRDAENDSDLVPWLFRRNQFSPAQRTTDLYPADGRGDL